MLRHRMPPISADTLPPTPAAFSAIWPDFKRDATSYISSIDKFASHNTYGHMLRAHDIDTFVGWMNSRSDVNAEEDYRNSTPIRNATVRAAEEAFDEQFLLSNELLGSWDTRAAANFLISSSFLQERALLARALHEGNDPMIRTIGADLQQHSIDTLHRFSWAYDTASAQHPTKRARRNDERRNSLIGVMSEMVGVYLANSGTPETGVIALPASMKSDLHDKTDLWCFLANPASTTQALPVQIKTTSSRDSGCSIPTISIQSLSGYGTKKLACDILHPSELGNQRVNHAARQMQARLQEICNEWFAQSNQDDTSHENMPLTAKM